VAVKKDALKLVVADAHELHVLPSVHVVVWTQFRVGDDIETQLRTQRSTEGYYNHNTTKCCRTLMNAHDISRFITFILE